MAALVLSPQTRVTSLFIYLLVLREYTIAMDERE